MKDQPPDADWIEDGGLLAGKELLVGWNLASSPEVEIEILAPAGQPPPRRPHLVRHARGRQAYRKRWHTGRG